MRNHAAGPRVRPVARYPRPRYPDWDRIRLHPSLLANIPRRWHQKPAVCAALAATLALGLNGCASQPGPSPDPAFSPQAQDATPPTPSPRPALSVPIFAFGTGMGAYGCVSVAPPVFLSEEEAAQVIREEALRCGIRFDADKDVSSTKLPYTNLNEFFDQKPARAKTYAGRLALDGYDETLRLGFEFVSVADIERWQDPNPGERISVSSYNAIGTAERLAKVLPDVAVFYDPIAADASAFEFAFDWDAPGMTQEEKSAAYQKLYQEAVEKYTTKGRADSIKALREQVCAFLEWLKGQGVI